MVDTRFNFEWTQMCLGCCYKEYNYVCSTVYRMNDISMLDLFVMMKQLVLIIFK